MTYSQYIGPIAGATLGYITAGTKGAITGFKLGQKHSMAPIPRRNTRSQHVVSKRTLRRKSSVASARSADFSMYSNRPSSNYSSAARAPRVPNPGGFTKRGNASQLKRITSRKVIIKKRRPVKVSSKFRKKVKKAMEAESLYGKYLKVGYGRITPPTLADQQTVFDDGYLFSPLSFVDAADVLFNGRVAIETPTYAGIEWDNVYARKDTIVNSYATYEIKNMSQRTYTLKMFVCSPKHVPTEQSPNDPVADWATGLILAQNFGTNPANNDRFTLYSDPRDAPQFNQFWKCDFTKVVLAPGESFNHTVQGPNDMVVDWSKLVLKNIAAAPNWLASYAKFSRSVFFVANTDLLVTSLAATARYPSTGGSVGGLVFERKVHMSLKCPESSGFKFPAGAYPAGTVKQLDAKLPTKVIKVFYTLGAVGVTQDVLEENPITIFDPTD